GPDKDDDEAVRPEATKSVPPPPTPAAPPTTPRPTTWSAVPPQSTSGETATLQSLLHSKDPKVASLAKELLDQLARQSAPYALVPSVVSGEGSNFRFEVVPPRSTAVAPVSPQPMAARLIPPAEYKAET